MENTETQTLENTSDESMLEPNSSQRRTQKGFTITLWGAAVLLLACLTNMFLPTDSYMYELALYGPTSIGASMVIYGFYCVFE
jgi:hypothetical protein